MFYAVCEGKIATDHKSPHHMSENGGQLYLLGPSRHLP